MKTTNYYNTFIEVSEDCPVKTAEVPPQKGDSKTAATLQFEMIAEHPYTFTSDDVLFEVFAEKNKISSKNRQAEREKFFSKGQACFRASPLAKRYGWGVHFDSEGKMAIYGVGSKEYQKFLKDKSLTHLKAMRGKRG